MHKNSKQKGFGNYTKLIVFNLLVFNLYYISSAQNAGSPKKDDSYDLNINKKIFSTALKNGDYIVATNAVYNIIARDTSNKGWQDSLCSLYFLQGANAQCIRTGISYLAYSPNNTRIATMIAFSEKNLGQFKESLSLFEEIYPQTKDLLHLYQIAELQYLCKRYGECEANIEELLKQEKEGLKINVAEGGQSTQQQAVPYKAAVLNLKGVMLFDLNKNTEAATCFQEAVNIFPDFVLAKNNLKMAASKIPAPSSTVRPATKK